MSHVAMELALTAREIEIVLLIAAGLSAKEIAKQLAVTPRTVEQHTAKALLKTGARNRTHMVVCALQNQLIGLSEISSPMMA
jgi:LuxR family transcriptional regulator, transcriptional regulator of spore coat protein